MAMWPSRTSLWGKKTRVVDLKPAVKAVANGHNKDDDYEDDEEDNNSKIEALEAKIDFLKSLLEHKESEIAGLQNQLRDNTQFMQKVVLELIQLKNTPVVGPATPKTSLEKYIENKNAGPKGKLP